VGHTGSVHDSWAFRSTRIFKEHERILAPGEWIWADSAYPSEAWCVSPFKKPIGGELTPDQRTYNYQLSQVCQACLWSATQRVLNSPPRVDPHSVGTCHRASQGSLPSVAQTPDPNFFTKISQMGHHLHTILHHPPQPYPPARGRRLRRGIP
jgi:hypothetical protein